MPFASPISAVLALFARRKTSMRRGGCSDACSLEDAVEKSDLESLCADRQNIQ
jgi:hypothetical protein